MGIAGDARSFCNIQMDLIGSLGSPPDRSFLFRLVQTTPRQALPSANHAAHRTRVYECGRKYTPAAHHFL